MPYPLKLAIWALLGVFILLLVAAAALTNTDLGRFRSTIESQLTSLLEREVAFDGELSIRIGSHIEVAMTQARLGGGSVGLPDLLSVGEASVELATLPLLSGHITVHKAQLEDIEIALVEQDDGRNNFSFPGGDDAGDDEEQGLPRVRLLDAELHSLALQYHTPQRKTPLVLELRQAAVSQQEDTTLALDGQLQGEPLQIKTHIAAGKGEDGAQDIAVTLTAQLGDIHGEGSARLDDLLAPTRPSGEFHLTGPDARYLTDLLHLEPITEGPLDLTVKLQEQGQQLSGNVDGRFGEFTLHSTALLDLPLELPTAQWRLDASGPDLAHLAPLTGLPKSFDGPFTVRGEANPGAEALAVQLEINTPTLTARVAGERAFDAVQALPTLQISLSGDSLRATGDTLNAGGLPEAPYSLDTELRVEDRSFRFDQLEIALGERRLRGALTFNMKQGYQVENLALVLDERHRINGGVTLTEDIESGQFEFTASSPDLFQISGRPQNLPDDIPGQLDLETRGQWEDGSWQLQQFDAVFANSSLSSVGSFDNPPDFHRTDLKFDLDIGSLAVFSELAGRELPDLPARLRFQLLGDLESVRIEKLDGQLGADTFSGSAAWVDGAVPQVVAILNAGRLDLSPFFPPPEPGAAAQPATPEPDTDADTRLIPDHPLSLEGLAQRNLRFSLQVGELVVAPRQLQDLVLRVTLEDGAFFVPELSFESPGGNFNGELGLLPHPDGVRLLTEFSGDGITLGLPAETAEDVAALPEFRLSSVLAGEGATTRELAASLDGFLAVTSGGGRIRSAASLYFASDFATSMINTVNPFREVDEFTEIRCSAIALTARNGVLEGEPLAILQTNRFSAELRGSIDLASEGLDINIRTIAEKGLGVGLTDLVNPFTRIGGTLARPRVELDPERAVKEGSFYIATLGLSLAAKRYRDRKLAGQDRCKLMLDEANPKFEELADLYRQHTKVYR